MTSYWLFAKHCLPTFLGQHEGTIINIGSIQAQQSQAGVVAYAAAKGAIASMTRAMVRASVGMLARVVSDSRSILLFCRYIPHFHLQFHFRRRSGPHHWAAHADFPRTPLLQQKDKTRLKVGLKRCAAGEW